jgi:hypothetical protein
LQLTAGSTIQPQQEENKNNDNSTLKTFDEPVALPTRVHSHPTRPRELYAFVDSMGG